VRALSLVSLLVSLSVDGSFLVIVSNSCAWFWTLPPLHMMRQLENLTLC